MPARMRAASPPIRHPDSFRAAGERHHLKRFSSPQSRPRNESGVTAEAGRALGEDKRLGDWPGSTFRIATTLHSTPPVLPRRREPRSPHRRQTLLCSTLNRSSARRYRKKKSGITRRREGAKVYRVGRRGPVIAIARWKGRYRGGRNTFAPSRLRVNIPRRYASRVSRIPIRPIPHPPRRHHAGRAVAARPAGPARGRGPA